MSTGERKRVAFCTFGCRLNQYDTEAIRTLLEASGRYEIVGVRDAADVYVVNTCSVTARADATARKTLRRLHAERPEATLVATGCYAQRAPEEIAAIEGVGLVVGAADRARIADELAAVSPGAPPRIAVSPVGEARTFLDVSITEMTERSRAFVKVQEGCNERCTFCIVPQTRGASRSRPLERVLEQVETLVASGHVEIVATGVHLGDYGLDLAGGRRRLAELVERVLALPGLQRFRVSSIEPASVDDALVDLMASEAKFARHFHIPFQSGSDAVLARMKRRYRADDFRRLVERIAARIPQCGIGTDAICGFPGETDEDFRRTFDLLSELPVTYVHPFTYSVRPGSEAARLGDQIPGEVKKRRTRALKRLSAEKTAAALGAHVGRRIEVLPESEGAPEGEPRAVSGWTDNYLKAVLEVGPASLPPAPGVVAARAVGVAGGALLAQVLSPPWP